MKSHTALYSKNSITKDNEEHIQIAEKIMTAALRQGLNFDIKTETVDNGCKRIKYRVSASTSTVGTCVEGFATCKDDPTLVLNLAIIDGAVVSHLMPPAIKEAVIVVGEPKTRVGIRIDHWRHYSQTLVDDGNRVLGHPDGFFMEQKGFWIGYSDIGVELVRVQDGTANIGYENITALIYAIGNGMGAVVKIVHKKQEDDEQLAVADEAVVIPRKSIFVWETKMDEMPFDVPLLCRVKDKPIPFLGKRTTTDETGVNMFLGTDESGYGVYEEIANITGYIDINAVEVQEQN